ncbi:hypothetical protein [Moritella sp. F3]|uniref:hypothetical protein n=1 Tax=Moritella sp. F3 TaxID=2718882 RepID=UPI0018E10140|nr:hypothetical protein [Moritella sp. F3]GIC77606.1 hypothetical protein FMO001_23330 [Moritella sp. F1]GIC82019.1 hypothetical protein FMO003_23000 [Moritella sp. F3]
MNNKSGSMFSSRTKDAKAQAKMLIIKKVAGKSYPCDLIFVPAEEFERIEKDPINPRDQDSLKFESSDSQFVNGLKEFGQITEGVARYKLNEQGERVYKTITLANGDSVERSIISVIDGLVRFDGVKKGGLPEYSVAVGKFDDAAAEIIMATSFDPHRVLSCLELAAVIDNMQTKGGKEYSPTELVKLLPFKKDRATISIAKKALLLAKSHPGIFSVFPSQPLVGKTTINQMSNIVLHVGATFSNNKRNEFFEYINELATDRSYWGSNKIEINSDEEMVTSKMYTKILTDIANKAKYKKPKKVTAKEPRYTEVDDNVSFFVENIGTDGNDKIVVKTNIVIEMINQDDSDLLVKLSSILCDESLDDTIRDQLKTLIS